jgi:Ca2+-binding RTX toxin-like protein
MNSFPDNHLWSAGRHRLLLALAAALGAALLLLPAAAGAAVVSSDGQTAHFSGDDSGERVIVDVEFSDEVSFSGEGLMAGPGCYGGAYTVKCPNGSGGIEMQMGGGDDVVTSIITSPRPASLRVDLGDGNDAFAGQENDDSVVGGSGDDELVSRGGADVLDGGPGNDTLTAGDGADRLAGGDGDDLFSGDSTESRSPDSIDGGAGNDVIDDYYTGADPATAPKVTITLAGGADDGLPGEGDDLRGIERVHAQAALDFSGDEGPNEAVAAEVAAASSLRGAGGNDALTGTNHDDVVDGGFGDDALTGGYGNDKIVGGPGRDTIEGDRPARCNEMHCDLDPGSSADQIDALDGSVDTIACGPGPDSVHADTADVVAADCESVQRDGNPKRSKAKLVAAGKVGLKRALAKGLVVRVSGVKPRHKVVLKAFVGKRLVARGSGRAKKTGAAKVRLRFSAAARKSLGRRKSVRLKIKGAGAQTALTLHR